MSELSSRKAGADRYIEDGCSGPTRVVLAIRSGNVLDLSDSLLGESLNKVQMACYRFDAPPNFALPSENLTFLHIAAVFNTLDCFVWLQTEKNLSISAQSSTNYHPIHYACYAGSTEIVSYILQRDSSQAVVLPEVPHHLLLLSVWARNEDILGLLISHGAKYNDPKNAQNDILGQAMFLGATDCVGRLWSEVAREVHDDKSYSPLMLAISLRKFDLAMYLIKAGFDTKHVRVAPKTQIKWTAMFLALGHATTAHPDQDWFEVVRPICEVDGRIDLDAGETVKAAIHFACQTGRPEIVRYLIDRGININRVDNRGRTGDRKSVV